jgi:hypothetical protein
VLEKEKKTGGKGQPDEAHLIFDIILNRVLQKVLELFQQRKED